VKIVLPQREHLTQTSGVDPTKFYYMPLVRRFYLARFADALTLLGGPVPTLLDIGCGSGVFLKELARHCQTLYACDLHPHVCYVPAMLKTEGVAGNVFRASATELPFKSESVDAIVAMSVLEHIRDLRPAADEFYRVLRPGGVAVIGIPMANAITEGLLRIAYLWLDGLLEDEHVSTHVDIERVFGRQLKLEGRLNIPRYLPGFTRLYCSMRLRKPS